MGFEFAIRLTEILLAFAFIQQSIEHLYIAKGAERFIFLSRIFFSIALMFSFWPSFAYVALFILALFMLNRFQGPYNGGSDRMSLLILCCLCGVHFITDRDWQEIVFGYLAFQLVLSYFMAGWVKVMNPEWRCGRALEDVFRFSAYPASESLRGWAHYPKTIFFTSWAVILFELIFPLTLMTQTTLIIGLGIATCFHFANACFLGLNRFFWIWIAAYPSILWLQDRVF